MYLVYQVIYTLYILGNYSGFAGGTTYLPWEAQLSASLQNGLGARGPGCYLVVLFPWVTDF